MMHSLILSVLRFLCKTFPNYLSLNYEILFLVDDFLKKSYIQIKKLYGYKFVRATKLFELKRRWKQHRRNHMKQCKLYHLMSGSRYVKKSRRKSKQTRDLLRIQMNETLIVFLFCLHFCLLRNFKIIRCIVKSLIYIQHIFVIEQLKKENLKSVFWAPEFGRPNRYTGLPNGLDTSLKRSMKFD